MHPMTAKKKLIRAVALLLFGAALGAGHLTLLGHPVRLSVRAKPCGDCASPTGTPERESDDGYEKLGPSMPGEWRNRFHEAAQDFADYRTFLMNWKCAHRTTFYLQPLGDAATRYGEVMERMRLYAEAFFGVPAKVLDPIPMFEDTLDAKRKQYDADLLINRLARCRPDDALVYIGITEKDLAVPGLNFVFGVGERRLRCGIYSLTRYETDDLPLFTRRSVSLLAHEAGHILSINHCVEYSCVMQGANSLEEHDSHPMHLCPVDLQKVLWNTGMDRKERYRKLLPLYQKWECRDEADWVARRLEQ
jgi:archaemetzincin